MKYNKDNLTFYIFSFIFLGMIVFVINIFNYFNPINLCYIKIEGDIVRGEEDTIRKAISYLRKNNKSAYKTMCKYVDIIGERYCQSYDSRVETLEHESWMVGCYVKGSKTVYIKPDKNSNEDIVKNRADMIKKYSYFSKNYWVNR